MKVIFEEGEIKAAIVDAVKNQIDIKDGLEIAVDIKAGRGENGLSAEISFVTPEATTPKATRTRASKQEVKPAEAGTGSQQTNAGPETGNATGADTGNTGTAETTGTAAGDQGNTGSSETAGNTGAVSDDGGASIGDQPAEAQQQADAAPKKPSLFSSIKRPVNT